MTARHVLTILAVADLRRAVDFYTRAFGWPKTVETPVYVEMSLPEGMRFGVYDRDGFARNTGQPPARIGTGEITSTEIYLYTADLAEAAERLRLAGARALSPIGPRAWGDEAGYFADPEGNVVVIARPLSAPAK
jgi:predicted enzyme related to lactoylglutathione lyase